MLWLFSHPFRREGPRSRSERHVSGEPASALSHLNRSGKKGLPEVRVCLFTLKEGKFKQQTVCGESCVKGFSDTGSTPVVSTKKEVTFVYQKLLLFLSKPQAWHIITTQSWISSAPLGLYIITRQRVSSLRLDDIQHFVLMICKAAP